MTNEELLSLNSGKKFDIVLMNPPYARDLHIDFLQKAVDICNKVVIIEPGQWLVQLKENGKYTKEDSKTKKLKNQIKGHVKSVELNNYNKEFNITNKTVCSITYIDMTNEFDEIEFENITEKKTVKTLDDCNLIGEGKIVNSILTKCKNYKEHMIDHCINIKKYNDYENKGYWFLPYGNYMINNLGTMQAHRWTNAFHMKTNLIDTLNSYFVVLASPKIEELTYNVVPKGIKSGGPKDSVYGKKKELENWQYFAYHNKLPLFISICLTIDENNNCKPYVPWLVDKQYTDEEIYKLLNINKEEQHLINDTIIKFDINSDWCKKLLNNTIKYRKMNNISIQHFIDLDYVTDTRKSRRKGTNSTQEFFTPWTIVKKMCDKIPQSDWSNPEKTFLEPSFGNGNFVLAIIYYRLNAGIDWKTALETLYGVELMEDNIIECKERVIELLDAMGVEYNKQEALSIMQRNLVCSDFFKWNFEEWRPIE